MKILTICEGGYVRSVSLANYLREWGHDAIPASWKRNHPDTIRLLASWADLVVVMEPYMLEKLPGEVRTRPPLALKVCNVGQDRFGYPGHADLIGMVAHWCKVEGLTPWAA